MTMILNLVTFENSMELQYQYHLISNLLQIMDEQKRLKLLSKYIEGGSKKPKVNNQASEHHGNIIVRDNDDAILQSPSSGSSSQQQSQEIRKKRIQSSDEGQQDQQEELRIKKKKRQLKEEARQQKQRKKDRKIKKQLRKSLGLGRDDDIDEFLDGLQIDGIDKNQVLEYLKQNKDIKVEEDTHRRKKKKDKVKKQEKDNEKLKYQMFEKESSSDLQIPNQARTVYRNKDGTIRKQSQKQQKEKKKEAVMNRLAQWEKGIKNQNSDDEQFAEQNYNENVMAATKNKIWDDPMKRWEANNTVKFLTCKFEGAANRFGIKPGYRWDGVIRGNGFENKYLQQKNLKKAEKQREHRQYMKHL